MTRILVVESGHDIASALMDELVRAGHEVEHVSDGAKALHRILTSPPTLTLLDIPLPSIDGLQVLERTRARNDHPIIMVTAPTRESDRLRAFELGADDCVCKPFSPREVVARIRTVLRRHPQHRYPVRSPVFAPVGVSRDQAALKGNALDLTRRESLLLQALSREPGKVLTRSKLLEAAFPEVLDANERTVDVHIKNLRRKLASSSTQAWIRSVYGVGFAWEALASQDR